MTLRSNQTMNIVDDEADDEDDEHLEQHDQDTSPSVERRPRQQSDRAPSITGVSIRTSVTGRGAVDQVADRRRAGLVERHPGRAARHDGSSATTGSTTVAAGSDDLDRRRRRRRRCGRGRAGGRARRVPGASGASDGDCAGADARVVQLAADDEAEVVAVAVGAAVDRRRRSRSMPPAGGDDPVRRGGQRRGGDRRA